MFHIVVSLYQESGSLDVGKAGMVHGLSLMLRIFFFHSSEGTASGFLQQILACSEAGRHPIRRFECETFRPCAVSDSLDLVSLLWLLRDICFALADCLVLVPDCFGAVRLLLLPALFIHSPLARLREQPASHFPSPAILATMAPALAWDSDCRRSSRSHPLR